MTKDDFEMYWKYASLAYPVVIMGAGRWGRVLASVISNARDHTDNMMIVSRSNSLSTKEWIHNHSSMSGLKMRENILDAISYFKDNCTEPPLFIVASRPSQHSADVLSLTPHNVPIMVEKPIAEKGDKASKLISQHSEFFTSTLSVGIEFSLSPAFHYISSIVKNNIQSMFLYWYDSQGERRYGEVKRYHEEIHVLDDIIYHAMSIFGIFASEGINGFSVMNASLHSNRLKGTIKLGSDRIVCQVNADQKAKERVRMLVIRTIGGDEIAIDFSDKNPLIRFSGKVLRLPKSYEKFSSNLRLEIGCIFSELKGKNKHSPLSTDINVFANLHKQINQFVG